MNDPSRYEKKLRETLTFLHVSGQAYDAGIECEALRIAVCLRVLFRDTQSHKGHQGSTSLASHLKAKSRWKIFSTNCQLGDSRSWVNLEADLRSATPLKARPKLGSTFPLTLSVNDWWTNEEVFGWEGKTYCREKIALAAANRDGGAHVDSKLEAFYCALASKTAIPIQLDASNVKYSGEAPFDQTTPQAAENVHFALLRQFAHEVLRSAEHFRWIPNLLVSPK